MTSVDLFVLEQSGEAKKLTGQILENWLVSFADGHGGIQDIVKTGSTGTNPVVDTYTIYLADETTKTFQVVNGVKGDTGAQTYVWIRYAAHYPTSDSDMGTSPDAWIGIYTGLSSSAPTHYTDYSWYEFKGETGETGAPATITTATIGYQQSDSGSVVPEGSWTTTVPSPVAGKFLWTRIQIQFNTGSPITAYSVARYGIDGSGAVVSVNGVSPDATGNVQLLAADIQAADSTSIQAHLTAAEDDIDELKTSLTTLDNEVGKEFHVGTGQTYTTLRAGIEAAVQKKNSKVIIHPGTYDLKTEFATELAQQTISQYTGNALYNGVHVIGMAGAIITAIFDGTESNIWQIYTMFSPFFAVSTHENNDYTLENIVIRANNCRYCVHDDPYGAGTYIHKYINCDMGFYNSMSPANYVACIGGGLGEHSVIDIDGGSYTSTTTVAQSGRTLADSQIPISYHNSNGANVQSWIHIHGVELKNSGHFAFHPYGSSTEQTYVFLSNCRIGAETEKSAVDASSQDNMTIYEFNMTKKYGQALVTDIVNISVTQGQNFCYVGAKTGYNLVGAIFSKSYSDDGDVVVGIAWTGYNYALFLRGNASSTETRTAILTWVKND